MKRYGKMKVAVYFPVLLSAFLLVACGGNGGESSAPTPPGADAVQLYDFITRQSSYTASPWGLWPGTGLLYAGREPHGALLTTYVNNVAGASIAAQNGMADGSIIVKENYMPDRTLAALTVMYKINGYDPAAGDWFWAQYSPTGDVMASGKVVMCIDCHANAQENELLFTGNVKNGGAAPAGVNVSFTWRVQSVFNAQCTVCHGAGGAASFLSLSSEASYTNIVSRPSTTTGTPPSGTLVIPGDSANSVLYQRVSGVGLPAGEALMPFGGALSTGDQNIIKAWIDQGANNN